METRVAVVSEAKEALEELEAELAKEDLDEQVIDRLLMKTMELGIRDAIVKFQDALEKKRT